MNSFLSASTGVSTQACTIYASAESDEEEPSMVSDLVLVKFIQPMTK